MTHTTTSGALAAGLVLILTCLCPLSAQNKAAQFLLGSGSWIDAPTSLDIASPTGVTVEAWVWVASPSQLFRGIVNVPSTNSVNEVSYRLLVSSNLQGNTAQFQANPVGGPIIGQISAESQVFSSAVWHHFAGTFDGHMIRLYVDGVPSAAYNYNGFLRPPNTLLQIGRLDGGSYFNNGFIDCVRIWSHARSQAEIATYRFFEIPSMPGLVASWHLNGNVLDSTGNHHGTITGAIPMVTPGAPITPLLSAPSLVGVGNVLTLQLSTPFPGVPYVLDVSTDGTTPGVFLSPILIPLNHAWLNYDSGGSYPSYFSNFLGLTDVNGSAQAFVSVPPLGYLAGRTISATYVLLEPGAAYGVGYIAPPTQTLLAGLPPVVSSVLPSFGPTAGGTSIAITGDRFVAGASVRVGGVSATNVNVLSAQQITCTTPPGTSGPKPVLVTNPDTISGSLPNGFTYQAPITLSQVTPLVAAAGAVITVTGNNIQAGPTVVVGGMPVTPTSVTATQITFVNPSGVPCNTTVQVTNPDGNSASKAFNPSPVVQGPPSPSGPAAGGNNVTFTGNNFFPGTTATVNGNPVSVNVSATILASLVMPPGSPGPVQVVFTSINGCSGSVTYTYN